jgi:putative hydrolase
MRTPVVNDRFPPLSPGIPFPVKLELPKLRDIDHNSPVEHHVHTAYTDGENSVLENMLAARSAGLVKILFSDHVRSDTSYFPSLVEEVRSLSFENLRSYVGVETKVLNSDGTLDCSTEIAASCDAIVGSVHSPPVQGTGRFARWERLDVESAMRLEFELAMAIVSKSRAHILGHPMGMVIKHFNVVPLEYLLKLAWACRDHDKAFELNARYCPSPRAWLETVTKAQCKITLGSDAHTSSEVGRAWKMFIQKPGN